MPMTLKLGMQHWVLEYYRVCSNYDPGLTLTYFTAEIIVVCDLKVATDDRSDKRFLSPGCCMPPAPGLYTCIESWKKIV